VLQSPAALGAFHKAEIEKVVADHKGNQHPSGLGNIDG
jgi:hypothetical protein